MKTIVRELRIRLEISIPDEATFPDEEVHALVEDALRTGSWNPDGRQWYPEGVGDIATAATIIP